MKYNTYSRAMDLYENVKFWHDQLYAKVRTTLFSLAGIFAMFSFFVGGYKGLKKSIDLLPICFTAAFWIAVFCSVIAISLLLLALTLRIKTSSATLPDDKKPYDSGKIASRSTNSSENSGINDDYSVWSPAFMHSLERRAYIDKISNMEDKQFTIDTLRYVHAIGDLTHRKIVIVNWALYFVFSVFIFLSIVVIGPIFFSIK